MMRQGNNNSCTLASGRHRGLAEMSSDMDGRGVQALSLGRILNLLMRVRARVCVCVCVCVCVRVRYTYALNYID